jgi:hypothetical protein
VHSHAGTFAFAAAFLFERRRDMADQRDKIGTLDRAAGEQEVRYFAATHGLSIETVRDLIDRFGNDRKTLEREAALAASRGEVPSRRS